ncbi:P-type ATPase [Candidatus Scalindua japonica]|uniref:P-type ATPase n=1 Tax=Candidatus Scalindua japonica TaxID=1284222 RepID=A0A286TT58_9BACT|nr:YHS domain-containing protein [Candidatus Scalindua japonica]GAX59092.1 P-type ATPase [Candidatus Scalindua japonica]
MRKALILGLVFAFLLGLSVTYTNNLALASSVRMVTDRVCTMQIAKDKAKTYKKDGYKYYFCSRKCKKIFKKNSEKYACICPKKSDGCGCFHCKGTGELCDCSEISVYTESHSGGHEHEEEAEDESGGHSH